MANGNSHIHESHIPHAAYVLRETNKAMAHDGTPEEVRTARLTRREDCNHMTYIARLESPHCLVTMLTAEFTPVSALFHGRKASRTSTMMNYVRLPFRTSEANSVPDFLHSHVLYVLWLYTAPRRCAIPLYLYTSPIQLLHSMSH